MRHHLFKTTNNLACFIPEWDEGVEPVTIPTQSIIDVPAMPSSDFGFVGVRWQGQTFLTLIRHFIASSVRYDAEGETVKLRMRGSGNGRATKARTRSGAGKK
jgi:hypothetical protein